METIEVWKDILWYEWMYQVSNLGKVRSLFRYNRELKWNTDWFWYKFVVLYKNKIWKVYKIHRLVMFAFVWENKLQVNHKNWIKSDNRLENLEYCTASQNIKHAFDVLWKKNNFQTNHPQKWKSCKNNHNSIKIKQFSKDWEFIKDWCSIMEVKRVLWISDANISKVCKWKRETAGWYKWSIIL